MTLVVPEGSAGKYESHDHWTSLLEYGYGCLITEGGCTGIYLDSVSP